MKGKKESSGKNIFFFVRKGTEFQQNMNIILTLTNNDTMYFLYRQHLDSLLHVPPRAFFILSLEGLQPHSKYYIHGHQEMFEWHWLLNYPNKIKSHCRYLLCLL